MGPRAHLHAVYRIASAANLTCHSWSEQGIITELANYVGKHPCLSPHVQMPELYCFLVQAEIGNTASSDADGDEQ